MNPYVLAHLAAIVAADLSVAHFGPSAIVINAFLFIGLDLTTRDRLHDAWHGRWLWPRMTTLIAAGSILSWIVNRDAGQIALASFVAFAAAGIVDTGAYVLLSRRPWWQRVNGSNAVAAAVDSVIFPTLAFGALMWPIVAGQFVAKVAGGAMWSVVLRRRASPTQAEAATAAAAADRLATACSAWYAAVDESPLPDHGMSKATAAEYEMDQAEEDYRARMAQGVGDGVDAVRL